MSEEDFQEQKPSYTFIGTSPGDELLGVARIHRREEKQLLDSAQAAQAEGREQEAKLLLDIAKERRERADEFEKAARGESSDPVVTEILSDQESISKSYVPYKSDYEAKLTPEEEEALASLAELPDPPPKGAFARAVAWLSGGKR